MDLLSNPVSMFISDAGCIVFDQHLNELAIGGFYAIDS
jgi:hypothetical protein